MCYVKTLANSGLAVYLSKDGMSSYIYSVGVESANIRKLEIYNLTQGCAEMNSAAG